MWSESLCFRVTEILHLLISRNKALLLPQFFSTIYYREIVYFLGLLRFWEAIMAGKAGFSILFSLFLLCFTTVANAQVPTLDPTNIANIVTRIQNITGQIQNLKAAGAELENARGALGDFSTSLVPAFVSKGGDDEKFQEQMKPEVPDAFNELAPSGKTVSQEDMKDMSKVESVVDTVLLDPEVAGDQNVDNIQKIRKLKSKFVKKSQTKGYAMSLSMQARHEEEVQTADDLADKTAKATTERDDMAALSAIQMEILKSISEMKMLQAVSVEGSSANVLGGVN